MDFTLQTPTLLFSAISLLMLAYTNRFIVIANLIRDLYAKYQEDPDPILSAQLSNLRRRMGYIRNMQVFGALSFLFSVLSLMLIFIQQVLLAEILFGLSLVWMLVSILLLILELNISVHALNIQLRDFKDR